TKYIRIDGKTSAKSRDGMRAQFQEDPDTKVSNSIDDIMWDTIQSKLNNVGRVLDGKTDSLQVASKTEAVRTSGTLDAYLQPATSPKRSSGAGGASGRAAAAGTEGSYGPPSKRSRG
ncbi:chromatin remodeling factor18, partial [Haematococcus lacustris]